MSIINAGLEEYRNAFFVLNEKLVAKQLVIEVKAIGGYAMLIITCVKEASLSMWIQQPKTIRRR